MTSSQPVKKRKSLIWRICYFLLCCIGAVCLWYVWPVTLVKPQFTISKETTYFTAPVDEEGYVNYQVALNETISQGVTADNNAMVLLVKAIGPHPEGPGDLRDEFYQRLGIARPPSEGNYLVRLTALGKERQWPEITDPYVGDEWIKQAVERPWTKEKLPRVTEWLERNREPLQIIEQATKRSRYYVPLVFGTNVTPGRVSLPAVVLPFLQISRDAGTMLVARSLQSIQSQNYHQAWSDLHTALRLSRMLAQGTTLIEMLVGIAIQLQVVDAANSLLECPLTLSLTQQIKNDLNQLGPLPNLAEQLQVGERCMSLDTFIMINRHGTGFLEQFAGRFKEFPLSSNQSLNRLRKADWNPKLIQINKWFDDLVACLRLKKKSERQECLADLQEQLQNLREQMVEAEQSWMRYFRSGQEEVNQLGDKTILIFTPAINKVMVAHDKATQKYRLLQLAVEVSIHRHRNWKYPEKLSELVPAPSADLLTDYYNDKPIQYRRTSKGYQIFSVGTNGIFLDASDVSFPDPDFVFTIPRPPVPIKGLEGLTGQLDEFTFHLANCFLHPSALAGGCSLPQLVLSMTSAHHLASIVPSDTPR